MPLLLEDIRVVEVATFVFAPAAGTVLSDFGAEVIHVESPGSGDPYRNLTRLRPLPECTENYCWILDSRNKKSLVLDLKTDAGREVLVELIGTADVFITNYHPSVIDDLGITYAALSTENPRLVYAHATGYGEVGDEAEKPGYDATAWWARSGLMDAVRPAGGELALATAGMGDVLAGVAGAFLAQGVDPAVAGALGLVTSGRAAVRAAKGASLLPEDVIKGLPHAMMEDGEGVTDLDLPFVVYDQEPSR